MSYSNYEQNVVINGYLLKGIQSVDGSYGIREKPVRVAGVGFIDAIVDAPLEGNFSISRKMVGTDPLLEKDILGKYLFDEQEIDGMVFYRDGTKGFGFSRAKISRYTVNCSVGQLPDIQVDFTVYGSLGKNVLNNSTYIVNQSFEYYPFEPDVIYNTAAVYLNGEDVTDVWNNATLKINYDVYRELSATTTFRRRGYLKRIYLGQDAFEMGTYADIQLKEHPPVKFPDQSSMKVIVSDFEIDAVSDFSYSRSINNMPTYALPRGTDDDWANPEGSASVKNLDPVQIDTQYPIETDINFTIIAEEYEIREIKDRIQSAPKSDVSIQVYDSEDGELINDYIGRNVRLISESINSSIDGEMSISLTYKGYESYHNQFY